MHQKVPTKQGGHSKIFEGAHPRPLFITPMPLEMARVSERRRLCGRKKRRTSGRADIKTSFE